jgi:hypothetical protein
MFGFDPDGTDVPPVIQRGQGVSGARRGRCAVRLEEEWAAEGNPRPLATGTFYIGVVVWGGGAGSARSRAGSLAASSGVGAVSIGGARRQRPYHA